MKTNFVIAGVSRSGTTSLRYYLSQHPHIYMCPQEDQGYFAQDEHFQLGIPNPDGYESKFKALSPKSLKGESCGDYMYNSTCLSRLQQYNPDIKIIAVLRNPAERAYSHWQMNVNQGIESRTFIDAINIEQEALHASDRKLNSPSSTYLSRGLYTGQIQNLLQYFDPHQLMFIRNENLRDDTEVVMYQVLQFLGLPYLESDRTPKNLGDYQLSLEPHEYNYLLSIFESDVKQLEQILDWNCNDWLRPIKANRPMMAYIAS